MQIARGPTSAEQPNKPLSACRRICAVVFTNGPQADVLFITLLWSNWSRKMAVTSLMDGKSWRVCCLFNLERKHDFSESQRNHCPWKMFDKSAAFPFWTLRHDTSLLWILLLPSQHMMPNCSSVWFTLSLSYQLWTGHVVSLLSSNPSRLHSFCMFLSAALNVMMTIVTNTTPRQKLPLAAKCQPPTPA